MKNEKRNIGDWSKRCLIVTHSYHHNNTLKVSNAFSKVSGAKVVAVESSDTDDLMEYEIIGFGAGIDSGKHYKPLLDFVDKLPSVKDKPAFIFSTSAVQGESKVRKDHLALRKTLVSKGYNILGEFSCKGFNTNSILKYIGGMNKSNPDQDDLGRAEEFMLNILESLSSDENKE